MLRVLIGIVVLVAVGLSGSAAAQSAKKTFQCWTNDRGQRECGDRVPPKYADKERQVIDERGLVVETKEGAKTPEQLAEEERKAKEAEERQRAAEYDRYLLESYRSSADIETMRDERVDLIQGRISAAEKSLADNEATLTDLRGRAAAQEKEGKKVHKRLQDQIAEYEKSLADNQRSLDRMTKELEAVSTKFDRDNRRFRELRGLPPPEPKPEPEAAEAGQGDEAAPAAQ